MQNWVMLNVLRTLQGMLFFSFLQALLARWSVSKETRFSQLTCPEIAFILNCIFS